MPNIIADISGDYAALLRLLAKMPDDEAISLGDMIDRGPDSRAVVEWFMANGRAVLANHEHMMLDYCRGADYYTPGTWETNGGDATLASFGGAIPEEVLDWVEQLPLYLEVEGCLLSHAFVCPGRSLAEACDLGAGSYDARFDRSLLWNREPPRRLRQYRMQIAGHNSQFGLRKFSDWRGVFAICLDDSRRGRLTGLHLPSMEIYQVECD
ncbi:MAG: metallophosphoesterase [Acetobacteraceae bacterium]